MINNITNALNQDRTNEVKNNDIIVFTFSATLQAEMVDVLT
jgi:hypothetical protein